MYRNNLTLRWPWAEFDAYEKN